jgi:hypothetical protein
VLQAVLQQVVRALGPLGGAAGHRAERKLGRVRAVRQQRPALATQCGGMSFIFLHT